MIRPQLPQTPRRTGILGQMIKSAVMAGKVHRERLYTFVSSHWARFDGAMERAKHILGIEAQIEGTEFLPGIGTIVNRPPAITTWLLPLLLMVLFSSAAVWAWVSEIDIVSPTQGRIVPSSRVKLIQSSDMAVVQEILVRDGDRVTVGQPLIRFDHTAEEAEAKRIRQELETARVEAIRFSALLGKEKNPLETYDRLAKGEAAIIAEERQILQSQWGNYTARQLSLDRRIDSLTAAKAAVTAEIEQLRSVLPFTERKVDRLRELVSRAHAAQVTLDEAEEQLLVRQRTLNIKQAEDSRAEAEIAMARQERVQLETDAYEKFNMDHGATVQRIAALEQELRKVERRLSWKTLNAPLAGEVYDLAVHTIGGVVQPAEILMRIVPDNSPLEVEVNILNRDIGFIRPGQQVEVKIETFNYTKYGALSGAVRKIASDATIDERLGPVYRAFISLDRDELMVENRHMKIMPGMSATVDIETGHRKLIEYILAPILRYRDEALRER
ncbi:MAG: HlyD family type I secretion periplasmic adaptor subunit [Alphaproteobacteria bacterium]